MKILNRSYYILLTIILFSLFIVIVLNINIQDENKSSIKEEIYIDENIDYYNPKYKRRYINYKKNNIRLNDEEVIKNVNMNLDLTPYENTYPANYLNTEKILVNKYYYLTSEYVPENLENISLSYALSNMRMVHNAKDAFERMAEAAKKEDLTIIAMSTYRSYNYQKNLYNRYLKQDDQKTVDSYSGRPGHSEHQTGLAVDVCNGNVDYTKFHETKEFEWMMKHAHEYGFILRFPKGKEHETGYKYESWHYRYVGDEIANYIYQNNISYEEYYATKIKDW